MGPALPVGPFVPSAGHILRPWFEPKVFQVDQQEFFIVLGEKTEPSLEHRGWIGRVIAQQTTRLQKAGERLALRGAVLPFIAALRLGHQSQSNPVLDVVAAPKAHERRRVVSVEAGDGFCRDFIHGDFCRWVDAEDADVHAEDIMTLHRFVDVERHGAEILADDLRALAMGFQIQDRVIFLGGVVHVQAVGGAKSIRHPEGAV